jgi:hypothetical protein
MSPNDHATKIVKKSGAPSSRLFGMGPLIVSNPHPLTIYLIFLKNCGAMPKRFEECQCEDDDVCLHCRIWVPSDDHYCWLQSPINPLSMEH